MKLNLNNDISVYRGETAAIDFKISQRSDYYVPFLISSARVNPMVCITIGSARRENNSIVSKQLWLDLTSVIRFSQTTVSDLGTIDNTLEAYNTDPELDAYLLSLFTPGIMYQYKLQSEVNAGTPVLHFGYSVMEEDTEVLHKDDYHFTVTLSLDESITLDMTNIDYFYQIELMDTEDMVEHIIALFEANPTLINKLPDDFNNNEAGIEAYRVECIAVINKAFPNHWGYRINNPVTSPVASVSNIQMLQPPKRFTVQTVVK